MKGPYRRRSHHKPKVPGSPKPEKNPEIHAEELYQTMLKIMAENKKPAVPVGRAGKIWR